MKQEIVSKVLELVAAHYSVPVIELGLRKNIVGRQVAVYILREEFKQRVDDIMTILDIKSRMTVHRDSANVSNLIQRDKKLAVLVQQIKDQATQGTNAPVKIVVANTSDELIARITDAVCNICLGHGILESSNATEDIKTTKALITFLTWKELKAESLEAVHLPEATFFEAIGRIDFLLGGPQGAILKKQIRKIHERYTK